jgi:hypothetical protein
MLDYLYRKPRKSVGLLVIEGNHPYADDALLCYLDNMVDGNGYRVYPRRIDSFVFASRTDRSTDRFSGAAQSFETNRQGRV